MGGWEREWGWGAFLEKMTLTGFPGYWGSRTPGSGIGDRGACVGVADEDHICGLLGHVRPTPPHCLRSEGVGEEVAAETLR